MIQTCDLRGLHKVILLQGESVGSPEERGGRKGVHSRGSQSSTDRHVSLSVCNIGKLMIDSRLQVKKAHVLEGLDEGSPTPDRIKS